MQVSQKLIFSIEKLVNPSNAKENLKQQYTPKTADLQNGRAIYSFGAIQLNSFKSKITNLTASIETNSSAIRKQIPPIVKIDFATSKTKNLYFFKQIKESKLFETDFKFNNTSINNFSELDEETFNTEANPVFANNIVEFDSTVIDDPPNQDYKNELIYLPMGNKNRPTIYDELAIFYSLSFQEWINLQTPIYLPEQSNYLLVFPYVTIPVPPSVFRNNILREIYGTISVSILLNYNIERVE